MSIVTREKHLEKALLRAAQKMMAMALSLEALGADKRLGEPAIRIRAEAGLAYSAVHKEFD